jgi:hypothetical protein
MEASPFPAQWPVPLVLSSRTGNEAAFWCLANPELLCTKVGLLARCRLENSTYAATAEFQYRSEQKMARELPCDCGSG